MRHRAATAWNPGDLAPIPDAALPALLHLFRGEEGKLILSVLLFLVKSSPVLSFPIVTAAIIDATSGGLAGDIVQFMDNPAVHGRRLCLLQVPPEEDAERTFECQGAEFRFIIDFGGVFSKFTAEEIVRGKAGACAARLHWRGGLMA